MKRYQVILTNYDKKRDKKNNQKKNSEPDSHIHMNNAVKSKHTLSKSLLEILTRNGFMQLYNF